MTYVPEYPRFLCGDDLFSYALALLLDEARHSRYVRSRGMEYAEVPNFVAGLAGPDASVRNPVRKQNPAFGLVERLSYLSGHGADPAAILHYNSKYAAFVEHDGLGVDAGAYGPRLYPQLGEVHRLLVSDRESRRGVANVYDFHLDGTSLRQVGANVPCTMFLHFVVRGDRLDLTACMRSNDVWLGLVYDMEAFVFLQQVMARWLGIGVGRYTHFVTSLHLYKGDVDAAERAAQWSPQPVAGWWPVPWDGPASPGRTYALLSEFWRLERLSRASVGLETGCDVSGFAAFKELDRECKYLSGGLQKLCDYNTRKAQNAVRK